MHWVLGKEGDTWSIKRAISESVQLVLTPSQLLMVAGPSVDSVSSSAT